MYIVRIDRLTLFQHPDYSAAAHQKAQTMIDDYNARHQEHAAEVFVPVHRNEVYDSGDDARQAHLLRTVQNHVTRLANAAGVRHELVVAGCMACNVREDGLLGTLWTPISEAGEVRPD